MKSRDQIAARDGVAGEKIIDQVRAMRGLPPLRVERTGEARKVQQQGGRPQAAGERRTPTTSREPRGSERREPIRFGPRKVRSS